MSIKKPAAKLQNFGSWQGAQHPANDLLFNVLNQTKCDTFVLKLKIIKNIGSNVSNKIVILYTVQLNKRFNCSYFHKFMSILYSRVIVNGVSWFKLLNGQRMICY